MSNLIEELEKRRNDLLKVYEEDPSEQVAGIILGMNVGLEAVKKDRASMREELIKRYKENGFKTKEFFDIIDSVLGEG